MILVLLYLLSFLDVAKLLYLLGFEPWEYARSVSFEKCCRMHQSTSQMDVWSLSYDYISCLIRGRQGSCSMTSPIVGMRNYFDPPPPSLPFPRGKKITQRGPLESKSSLPANWQGRASHMSYQYHSIKFDFPVTMQSSAPLGSADQRFSEWVTKFQRFCQK